MGKFHDARKTEEQGNAMGGWTHHFKEDENGLSSTRRMDWLSRLNQGLEVGRA
jgi:hypothetical protein